MKWFMVTTARRDSRTLGSNVGDEFAFIGCRTLIKSVDLGAGIERFDKQIPNAWDPAIERHYDKLVICGMPLFWSLGGQTEKDIWWWDFMWNGWMSHRPKDIIALGVGHVVIDAPEKPKEYYAGMEEAVAKSWRVVAREPIALAHPKIVDSICPSAFALSPQPTKPLHRVCNLMEGGGHFGYVDGLAEKWEKEQVIEVSNTLFDMGFVFVAHTWRERNYALKLGWPAERIRLFPSAQEYLDFYRTASCYVGNRMHGAAVCAAQGTPTWGFTHDSRRGMVTRLGGKATPVADATPSKIRTWVEADMRSIPQPGFEVPTQRLAMQKLLRQFMAS